MCIFRKPRLKIRLMRTGVCRPHHCTPLVQKSSASKIQLRNNAKNLEWVHFILWLTTRTKFLQFYPSTVDKQKKKFFPVATTHLSRESCRYKASPIILLFVNLTTTTKKNQASHWLHQWCVFFLTVRTRTCREITQVLDTSSPPESNTVTAQKDHSNT